MQKTIFFLCFCAISLLLTHNEAFAQTESSTSAMAGINATPKDGLEFYQKFIGGIRFILVTLFNPAKCRLEDWQTHEDQQTETVTY